MPAISFSLHYLVLLLNITYHAIDEVLKTVLLFSQHNKLQQRVAPCPRNQVRLRTMWFITKNFQLITQF